MACDYEAIRRENERRYGTDIGRIGPMLLADRYDDRTHFIFELLQNAEDALSRRTETRGSRAVSFHLSNTDLRVSHFGKVFDEADVRGICGIGEGTKSKDLTAIGKFGIGFKAVYALTDSPEIYSGDERFAIDSFVWPREIDPISIRPRETIFSFPLRPRDSTAYREIAEGLKGLGIRTLLFLREIEEVSWTIENGTAGTYRRSQPCQLSKNARRVALSSDESGLKESETETWLICSRQVRNQGRHAGHVEIAFNLEQDTNSQRLSISPITDSPLVVFFPTIVQTNLGCLLQGPYRTTPSRDNVPRHDSWNEYLVKQTAHLLVEALHLLKRMKLVSISTLMSLPIDHTKFPKDSMFVPLFDATRRAIKSARLLPAYRAGHICGQEAKLARSKELRELVKPSQLGHLHGSKRKLYWLSEDITRDRTPKLRDYLVSVLGIQEIDPDTFVKKLSRSFLQAQDDSWITKFYVFLAGQPFLWKWGGLKELPLIRLESGKHVVPYIGKNPQAFLPGAPVTEFPTVKKSVCAHKDALKFRSFRV